MKIKSLFAKPFASFIYKQIQKSKFSAVADQEAVLQMLIKIGQTTVIGKETGLEKVKTYEDFKQAIPIRPYEAFIPYVNMIKEGKHNVLWKGRPIYFAKTSGTTSGIKYIPITKDSVGNHFGSARNAALCYAAETGNTNFFDGKLIFLSGSPILERMGGIPTGRLSGISNHLIPRYLRTNQLPSFETNCIEDWEEKLQKIVDETIHQNMALISGIPPWVQMYFDELSSRSGKKIGELFPNFKVMIHGGVNFEPYKPRLLESIGRPIDIIEVFPASEGFFAFQDSQEEPGLLLNTNDGIFFEFIPMKDLEEKKPNPTRLQLKDVELNTNYAMIISSNAGLWGYDLGDTVKFVNLNPYRLVVTGRTKHFISAFGEHVITEEVEKSVFEASEKFGLKITEFTVAPFVSNIEGKSYHEWFIEFEESPNDISEFSIFLDGRLREKNTYYDDLVSGNILLPLKISRVSKNGFIDYMKSIGKLGGQNKVPRLSNNRQIAGDIEKWVESPLVT